MMTSKAADYNVYFGRDPKLSEQKGNLWLKGVISAYLFKYESATRSEKSKLLSHIVHMVHLRGGKFLRHNNMNKPVVYNTNTSEGCQEFVEVSFEQARGKVGHLFRDSMESTRKRRWDDFPMDEATYYRNFAYSMDHARMGDEDILYLLRAPLLVLASEVTFPPTDWP